MHSDRRHLARKSDSFFSLSHMFKSDIRERANYFPSQGSEQERGREREREDGSGGTGTESVLANANP